MSIAFLDSSIENQKGGYIKLNQIISLNTIFHKWHLYCLPVAPCLLLEPHLSYFPTLLSAMIGAEYWAEAMRHVYVSAELSESEPMMWSVGGQLGQKQIRQM